MHAPAWCRLSLEQHALHAPAWCRPGGARASIAKMSTFSISRTSVKRALQYFMTVCPRRRQKRPTISKWPPKETSSGTGKAQAACSGERPLRQASTVCNVRPHCTQSIRPLTDHSLAVATALPDSSSPCGDLCWHRSRWRARRSRRTDCAARLRHMTTGPQAQPPAAILPFAISFGTRTSLRARPENGLFRCTWRACRRAAQGCTGQAAPGIFGPLRCG